MKIRIALAAVVVAGAVGIAAPVAASPLSVQSYSMLNGDGQASGGSFNYWDKAYTGAGATTTDGAALSGGLGDLTDGVVASDFWYNTENSAGTGPYVGWYDAVTPNPVITFNFAGATTVNGISIHVDNSYAGRVFAPGTILVDGVVQTFTAPTIGTIGWINLTGLNFTGASHTIEFDQDPNLRGWTFVSEITFDGGAVPEPATWTLMIGGFGLAGAALRRRRIAPA